MAMSARVPSAIAVRSGEAWRAARVKAPLVAWLMICTGSGNEALVGVLLMSRVLWPPCLGKKKNVKRGQQRHRADRSVQVVPAAKTIRAGSERKAIRQLGEMYSRGTYRSLLGVQLTAGIKKPGPINYN